ncbi:MAG: transglutaminase domain-containing protein [bacterium]
MKNKLIRLFLGIFIAVLCSGGLSFGQVSGENVLREFKKPVKTVLAENNFNLQSIQCLMVDPGGFVWVGSEDGLSVVNFSDSLIRVTLPGQEKSLGVKALAFEPIAAAEALRNDAGSIWFLTSRGILTLSRSGVCREISMEGLPELEAVDLAMNRGRHKYLRMADDSVYEMGFDNRWTQSKSDWETISSPLTNEDPFAFRLLGRRFYTPFDWDKVERLRRGTWKDKIDPSEFPYRITRTEWQKKDDDNSRVSLKVFLPLEHYVPYAWTYTLLWLDKGWNTLNPEYILAGDPEGNEWLEVSGDFSKAQILTCGVCRGLGGLFPAFDQSKSYPFPGEYPPEVSKYLSNREDLLPTNPELTDLVQNAIQPSSKGDMLKTAKDIALSPLFQMMAYDYAGERLLEKPLSSCIDTFSFDLTGALRKNIGDAYTKAQLFAAMARLAGIPARVVFDGRSWDELWINGPGWIPVEITHPLYDYAWTTFHRLSLPKTGITQDQVVTGFTGWGEKNSPLSWNPNVEAFYSRPVNSRELLVPEKLSEFALMVVRPATTDNPPREALLPLGKGVLGFFKKEGHLSYLVLRKENGEDIKIRPWRYLKYNATNRYDIKNVLAWEFIARRAGDFLIIENIRLNTNK